MPAWNDPYWSQPPLCLIEQAAPCIALFWAVFVILVIMIGTFHLFQAFLTSIPRPISSSLAPSQVPHVTLIRPVDGLEPLLYECLAASFTQNFPKSKLSIAFCVASKDDPSYPTLEKLLKDHPYDNARIYVEDEDPNLHGPAGSEANLGPNPKIRNMSRAYHEARGEVVWIADCNVWISASVCGLMVDRLCGFSGGKGSGKDGKDGKYGQEGRKFKFVHQLPLAVDVSRRLNARSAVEGSGTVGSAGAALDELFLSTSHAKFYTAISTVAVAPCIVGKSNMFRKAHLDALTPASRAGRSAGLDFFSDNICEDHLIGDLLWRTKVPAELQLVAAMEGREPEPKAHASDSKSPLSIPQSSWGNHAILTCPPCIQPLSNHSLGAYAARRARWLRVRKFTVPVATLVEPGTESLIACACLAYGLSSVSQTSAALGLQPTWIDFAKVFVLAMLCWMCLDYAVWRVLQSWRGERGEAKSVFGGSESRKGFLLWFRAWAGREALAFPVWAWAVLGGTTVVWRGRRFWVGMDMRVHAIDGRGEKDR